MDRSFNKFTDAAKEAGKSRIYGGIHWSFDMAIGLQQGRKVGQYVADRYFNRLPDDGESLRSATLPGSPTSESLRADQVQPLLAEALARWQAGGVDVSVLKGVEVRITNLGGLTLGTAADGVIHLDGNAAGWGWFVDQTPSDDSEFVTAGDQGEARRIDLLSVLEHEIGHLLGRDHEGGGVMQETLEAGVRQTNGPALGEAAAFLDAAQAWFASEAFGGRKR